MHQRALAFFLIGLTLLAASGCDRKRVVPEPPPRKTEQSPPKRPPVAPKASRDQPTVQPLRVELDGKKADVNAALAFGTGGRAITLGLWPSSTTCADVKKDLEKTTREAIVLLVVAPNPSSGREESWRVTKAQTRGELARDTGTVKIREQVVEDGGQIRARVDITLKSSSKILAHAVGDVEAKGCGQVVPSAAERQQPVKVIVGRSRVHIKGALLSPKGDGSELELSSVPSDCSVRNHPADARIRLTLIDGLTQVTSVWVAGDLLTDGERAADLTSRDEKGDLKPSPIRGKIKREGDDRITVWLGGSHTFGEGTRFRIDGDVEALRCPQSRQ